MASTVLPTKGMCFSFSVPTDTDVDEIMEAFQVTAGSGGLKSLQHQASPGALDTQESDVANSSYSPGRLVIDDDTDITPGQREPSTRSVLLLSTQQAGKILRCKTTDALNEVVNRIREVQCGGARTHLIAVFVTRFDANCSSADVREHLGQFFGPKELRCTKLKTRYGGYSSFHVAAVDDDIEALFDPNIWPEGCLFREFQGRLTESRVRDENERIE
ncbi:hypothetical protein HPB47_000521 [Ixodes persulcatus]|uniref:Uncharacterized protein n=1 Tax=Ixodes persulcatus TaxID=34615 RepID=A0AC60PT49_IXOPE|nr:hypothetical protein HPB47_000521 [Ixodes persulcatus]